MFFMSNLKYAAGFAAALAPYALAAWSLFPAALAALWLAATALAAFYAYVVLDCLYAGGGAGAKLRVAFYAFITTSLHFAATLLASWAPLVVVPPDEVSAAVGRVIMGAWAAIAPTASIVAAAFGAPRVVVGSLLLHLFAAYYLRLLS